MPSYKEHFKDRWLTAAHLQGQPVNITIEAVTETEVYNTLTRQKERRIAASFPRREIQLLLNKTHCQALEKLTQTDQWDRWRNVPVTLLTDRAPNGKDTIKIVAQRPAATSKNTAAPAPVHGQVHGQQNSQVHGQVHGQQPPLHGRVEDDVAFGEMQQLGLHLDDMQEPADDNLDDDLDDLVHGHEGEEETSGEPDPKSDGAGAGDSESIDDVFFSVTDLLDKARSLHMASTEPMTEKQHAYIVKRLSDLTGKDGLLILRQLTQKEVTESDRAGYDLGVYLFEVTKANTPLPRVYERLLEYAKHYIKVKA